MKNRKFLLSLCILAWCLPGAATAYTTAKYVIIMQGDGMGAEHIRAAGMYVNGAAGSLVFESFPNQTTMRHNNASNTTTDSAASASAMATGHKVDNGIISILTPGNGADATSALELHKMLGRSTGLVTESYLTDASPAGHGAHDVSRYNNAAIFGDFMNQTQPQILFGGGANGFDTSLAAARGYTVVTNRTALLALNPATQTRVAGSFGSGLIPPDGEPGRDASLPTLPEMVQPALAVLANDPDGFFVFIEHEGIDEGGHTNDGEYLVRSIKEFNSAVQSAIDWVNDPTTDADWNNTLLMVVADHETGGLTVTETNPQIGVVPAMTWSATGHTQTPVRVFALGLDASQITGVQIDNTNIFSMISPPIASVSTSSTLTTGADTWMDAAAPATTHGSDAKLVIDGSPDNGALIRWNLGVIPAGSTILSATILFYLPDANDQSGSVFKLYASTRAWSDSTATWNNYDTSLAWGTPGAQNPASDYTNTLLASTPLGGTPPTQLACSLNVDGIAQLQRWVSGTDPNYGFVIFDYADTASDGFRFNSFDSTHPPQLVINYCPPTTPTSTPSRTSTATPSPTPTISPSITATATLSNTATASPTPTASPSITATATLSSTASASPTPTASPSITATATLSSTATASPTPTASLTVSATATLPDTPSNTLTATPSCTVTLTLTSSPLTTATVAASPTPTATMVSPLIPTSSPSASPAFFPPDLKGRLILASPNPGKAQITFHLMLEHNESVKIIIFNLAGERTAVLQEFLPAGSGKLVWQCQAAAPGMYLARVWFGDTLITTLKLSVFR